MSARKLLLRNFQSPGDIVMLTAAVRDLHRAYPGTFATDVRTSAAALWNHNPHLTPLDEGDEDVEIIDCEYPLIHRSNELQAHFLEGFIRDLNERLALRIRLTDFHGDIHLSQAERMQMPCGLERRRGAPLWIVAAGGKYDYTIKWWDVRRYQKVVSALGDRVQFAQVGEAGHYHPAILGAIDLRGRTSLRDLVSLVHHADGVLTPVSFLMHLAAAVECRPGRSRACVVVAGGREPVHWEAYPGHDFLHTVGALPCCQDGGCWRSRTLPLRDGDAKDEPDQRCMDVVGYLPRCMDAISADHVIECIERCIHGDARGTRRRIDPVQADPPLTPATARDRADRFVASRGPAMPEHAGRGIVICAGGSRYLPPAWVTIRVLRMLGCRLPIQLWYLGPSEMGIRAIARLAQWDVECVDAHEVRRAHPARILNGWELKPYAIIHSPFREVLLIDADNVPTRDPEYLFATPQFSKHGALFWPDRDRLGRDHPIWELCGVAWRGDFAFESGQVAVDKSRCWTALRLCMWLNEHSDFYYRYVHGDKETFHLAFRKCNAAFAMAPAPPIYRQGIFYQRDFDGQVVFQHGRKWSFEPDSDREGYVHEAACRRFLAELEAEWLVLDPSRSSIPVPASEPAALALVP
jgi:ADP-heptose:LPS heptosyltransferase